jgi:O-antigen/teichoic acid export membrane protein
VVWAGILGTVAQLGLPQSIVYFTARHADELGAITRVILGIYVMQSVGFFCLGWCVAGLVLQKMQPTAVGIVRLYLLSFPLANAMAYISAIAQGMKRFRAGAVLSVVSSAAYVLAVCVAGLLRFHAASQFLQLMLGSQLIVLVGTLIWFYHWLRPGGRFEWSWARRLLGYSLKSYGSNLSWIANARMDQFVMTAVVSLESLGQYAVAVSFAGVLYPIAGALATLVFPHVASGTRETAGRKIGLALALNMLVSCGGGGLLGFLSRFLIPFLFGTAFMPAVVPAEVLLGGTVLLACNNVLENGLRGLGHPLIPTLGELAGVVATLVGLWFLLPRWGILGAAWASVLSYGVTSTVVAFSMLRVLHRQDAPGYGTVA